jgi:hypothetical protein
MHDVDDTAIPRRDCSQELCLLVHRYSEAGVPPDVIYGALLDSLLVAARMDPRTTALHLANVIAGDASFRAARHCLKQFGRRQAA